MLKTVNINIEFCIVFVSPFYMLSFILLYPIVWDQSFGTKMPRKKAERRKAKEVFWRWNCFLKIRSLPHTKIFLSQLAWKKLQQGRKKLEPFLLSNNIIKGFSWYSMLSVLLFFNWPLKLIKLSKPEQGKNIWLL